MEYIDLIIDEINRKEKDRNDERPFLELPLPEPKYFDEVLDKKEVEEPKRVIIIEL
tara:strand:+ start:1064 stop:1231 length:168 start_codon:yes stop_codon:yes gene_type:complete